ncbi:MAG: hypothetical protein ACRD7E_18850, partial [Bryobacteraceae bacterium]
LPPRVSIHYGSMESMYDLLGRIARPYVRLSSLESDLSGDLSPLDLAALYIIRSLELLREQNDAGEAARRHQELADELRKIMTEAAQDGHSFRDILLECAINGTAQRIMDLKKPKTVQ